MRGVFPLFLATAFGIVNGNLKSDLSGFHWLTQEHRNMGIRPRFRGTATGKKGEGKVFRLANLLLGCY